MLYDDKDRPLTDMGAVSNYFKTRGTPFEKLPLESQREIAALYPEPKGWGSARRAVASVGEALAGIAAAPLTTLPGIVESGLAFGAEKVGATDFAKTMRTDAANSFALGERVQKAVGGALRSEQDLVSKRAQQREVQNAGAQAEAEGSGFLGQLGAEAKTFANQIGADPMTGVELGLNVLAQGFGVGKLASAGSQKLLQSELKKVGASGLKGDALKAAGDAAVAKVNRSVDFQVKLTNAGLVGGDSAGSAYEKLGNIPDAVWMDNQNFFDRVVAGEDPVTVKQDIASQWAGASGALGVAGGVALNKIVGTPLESAFTKTFTTAKPAKSLGRVQQAAVGAGRGALEEVPEEVGLGAVLPNVAAMQVNPEQRLSEGTGQALIGGLAGGGAAGGLAGSRAAGQQVEVTPSQQEPNRLAQEPTLTDEPLMAQDPAVAQEPTLTQEPLLAQQQGGPVELTAEEETAAEMASQPAPSRRLAVDPLATDPLAVDPLATDPLATDALATVADPTTVDPLATDPLANDATVADPMAVDPTTAEQVAPTDLVETDTSASSVNEVGVVAVKNADGQWSPTDASGQLLADAPTFATAAEATSYRRANVRSSIPVATQRIKQAFGIRGLAGLGRVKLLAQVPAGVPADAKARLTKGGVIELYPQRIPAGREVGTLLHEVFHLQADVALTERQNRLLLAQVQSWKNAPLDSVERQVHDYATRKGQGNPAETLAYAVEEAVALGVTPTAGQPDTAGGWLASVKRYFEAALQKLMPNYKGSLYARDLVDIAFGLAGLDAKDVADGSFDSDQYSQNDKTTKDRLNKLMQRLGETEAMSSVASWGDKLKMSFIDRFTQTMGLINSWDIPQVVKKQLDDSLSRTQTIANSLQKVSKARLAAAYEAIAKSDAPPANMATEERIKWANLHAQLSTIEDATTRFIEAGLPAEMADDPKDAAVKLADGPEQRRMRFLASAFADAANNKKTIEVQLSDIKGEATRLTAIELVRDIATTRQVPLDKPVEELTFEQAIEVLAGQPADAMRLPGGYLIADAKAAMDDIAKKMGGTTLLGDHYKALNDIVMFMVEQAVANGRMEQSDLDRYRQTRYLPLRLGTELDKDSTIYEGFRLNRGNKDNLRVNRIMSPTGYFVLGDAEPLDAGKAVLEFTKTMSDGVAKNQFLNRMFQLARSNPELDMKFRMIAPDAQLGQGEVLVFGRSKKGKLVPFALTLPYQVRTDFDLADKEVPWKTVGKATALLGRAYTRWNPTFGIANSLVSDTFGRWQYAVLNNDTTAPGPDGKPIKLGALKTTKNFIAETLFSPRAVKQMMAAGAKLEDGSLFTTEPANDVERDLLDLAQSGALSMLSDVIRVHNESVDNSIREVLSDSTVNIDGTKWGAVKNTAKGASRGVAKWNSWFESIAPLTMYRAVINSLVSEGVSETEARRAANAIVLESLNYARKGTATNALSSLYLFFAPAMAESKNLARALVNKPERLAALVAAMAVASQALYMLAAAGGDDEEALGNALDRKELGSILSNISIGGVKIPLPQGLPRVVWGWVNIVNRVANGHIDSAEGVRNAFEVVGKSVSPVAPAEGEMAKDFLGVLINTSVPTLFKPAVNAAADRNSFGSKNLRSPTASKMDAAEQGMASTPETYKDIARWADKLGLGMTPEAVRTLLEGYMAGPLSLVPSTINYNAKKESGKDAGLDPATKFFLGRFIDSSTKESAVDRAFYDKLGDGQAILYGKLVMGEDKMYRFKEDYPFSERDLRLAELAKTWENYSKTVGSAQQQLKQAEKRKALGTELTELRQRAYADKLGFILKAKQIEAQYIDR